MRWLKEPLFHFLLIGVGLFVLFYQVSDEPADRADRIVVAADEIERMAALWSRRWQRPPTTAELDGLIESHIREEVLYREARALGLEQDDTIVRRRMAQKMEFLFQDIAQPAEPTDAALEAFLEQNVARFQESARFSFMHVYLSADKRGGQAAQDARLLFDDLRIQGENADPAAVSDPLMLNHRVVDRSEREIARMLGREFTDALSALSVKQWHGPIESAYGLHLVYVYDRIAPRLPALAEIRDRVRTELLSAKRREANEAMFKELRSRYEIVVDKPGGERLANLTAPSR